MINETAPKYLKNEISLKLHNIIVTFQIIQDENTVEFVSHLKVIRENSYNVLYCL